MSLIKDVEGALTICAELGINAITTCMWNVNGWLAEKLGLHVTSHEFDKNEWTVYGEPNTTIVVERHATVELTCASIVNRIPDVINAKPGYVPTAEMGELNFRIKNLNEYVD